MTSYFLIFPIHLFEDIKLLIKHKCLLIEDPIYFTKYVFHKTKLLFHRASMKAYYDYLKQKNIDVTYIDYTTTHNTYSNTFKTGDTITYYNPEDFDLTEKLTQIKDKYRAKITVLENPNFLLDSKGIQAYLTSVAQTQKLKTSQVSRHFLHDASFYRWIRRYLDILINHKDDNDQGGKPVLGKWTFDRENRKPFPKNTKEPINDKVYKNKYYDEATTYVNAHFNLNFGAINPIYPITFAETRTVFKDFIKKKLALFGPYEDAIGKDITTGYHSGMSAMLNVGLIMSRELIEQVLKVYEGADTKQKRALIPSVEGFIRQIIGWREYMRLLYRVHGREIKTMNYFGNSAKLSATWFDASSRNVYKDKIPIIYDMIKKTHDRAYLHHIERLMIMGNFALYNEISPREIYDWYMICFIDAYDWVMVANVYGMSQYALEDMSITQRPYLCGSSYLCKMSDYKKDKWCEYWDALFYHFVNKHRGKLNKYRTYLFVKMYDAKTDKQKKQLLANYNSITNYK